MRAWAIVVAAGAGERLDVDRPKAFVRLGNRTILAAALAMLDEHELIDGIVMVVPEGWEDKASLLADDLCSSKISAAVAGGASRADSVACGLECIPDTATHVLVHDAARALTPAAVVDRVIAALADGADGAVPALSVVDTVKQVGPDSTVSATLDRAALRAVQTPQGFPLAILRAAIERRGEIASTDCSSLVEHCGGRVVCVEGDELAFKITTRPDLARAEQLIGSADQSES